MAQTPETQRFFVSTSTEDIAYFDHGQRSPSPLTQPVDRYPDDAWLDLVYTDPQRPLTSIAVAVDPTMPDKAYTSTAQAPLPLARIAERLGEILRESHRVTVLAKDRFNAALASLPAATPWWRIAEHLDSLDVDYLFVAVVKEWSPAVAAPGLRSAGRQRHDQNLSASARVAITLRIFATDTGQSLYSITELGHLTVFDLRQRPTTVSSTLDLTSPAEAALEVALQKTVFRASQWLARRPWRTRVLSSHDGEIVIAGGTAKGLEPGLELDALAADEPLIDPETGLEHGTTTMKIGRLRIVQVDKQQSTARVVEGCEGLQSGDLVELAP